MIPFMIVANNYSDFTKWMRANMPYYKGQKMADMYVGIDNLDSARGLERGTPYIEITGQHIEEWFRQRFMRVSRDPHRLEAVQ